MKKLNIIKKKTAIFALACAVLTGCVGCGKKESSFEDFGNRSAREEVNYESTEAYSEPAAENDYSYGAEESDERSSFAIDASAAEAAGPEFKGQLSGTGSGANHEINPEATNTLTAIEKDKLVFRCNLEFETLDYNTSLDKVHQLIQNYNGFVEFEDVSTEPGYRDGKTYYSYRATIRVPSASFDSFVNETGDIGELISKNQNVDNFSKEYSDLSAELEVLETKYQSYLEMMKEAKSLDDMETLLMLDDRITEVEVQISQIKRRMNTIDNDVAYSYVSINIREVQKYEEAPAETFGDRIGRALRDGWETFRAGCEDFAVDFTENLPRIIITLVIVLLTWFLLVRRILRALGVPTLKQMRKNSKMRKEMKKAQAAAPEAPATEAPVAEPPAQQPTEAAGSADQNQ